MKRRALACVGHDAHRAGAQMSFLATVRWLRTTTDPDLLIALKRGGELVADYRAVAPTVVMEPTGSPRVGFGAHLRRALGHARPAGAAPSRELARWPIGLVYANSVASVDVLGQLRAMWNCPVLCHVRELEMGIREFCGVERFRAARPAIDAYIAGSAAVAENLVERHGIPSDRVYRVGIGIPLPAVDAPDHRRLRTETGNRLGIPADACVVGGCGSSDWRKGADLFVQVARLTSAAGSPAHFVWVGGSPLELERLRRDTEQLDLGGRVHWVGPQPDPLPYFARFDVFLLTSREDPMPLVGLEAAALGVPTICFRGAGGMPHFVEEDAGFAVPYLDIEAAAVRVLALEGCPARRAELGRRAAEKVRARHSIEQMGQKLADVFARYR